MQSLQNAVFRSFGSKAISRVVPRNQIKNVQFRLFSDEFSNETSTQTFEPAPGFQRVYVGNLPFRVREGDLRVLFERFGEVKSARIILDKETRRSRGYAFVEIPESSVANAIKELHSSSFQGRQIIVSEARQRDPNSPPPRRERSFGSFSGNDNSQGYPPLFGDKGSDSSSIFSKSNRGDNRSFSTKTSFDQLD